MKKTETIFVIKYWSTIGILELEAEVCGENGEYRKPVGEYKHMFLDKNAFSNTKDEAIEAVNRERDKMIMKLQKKIKSLNQLDINSKFKKV
jgi:hypothetical protein